MSRNSAEKSAQPPRQEPAPEPPPARFVHTDLFVSLVVSAVYLSILSVLVFAILS